jgi:hypothetical protein
MMAAKAAGMMLRFILISRLVFRKTCPGRDPRIMPRQTLGTGAPNRHDPSRETTMEI